MALLMDHPLTLWDREVVKKRRNHQIHIVSWICMWNQKSTDISLESTSLGVMIFLTLETLPKGFNEDEFEEPPHPAKQTYHD